MLSYLKGKKTFFFCGLSIIWAIIGWSQGWLDPQMAQGTILAALTGAGLRDALK